MNTKAASSGPIAQCSFCQQRGRRLLLQSRTDLAAYICDECVHVCMSILEDDRANPPSDEELAALPMSDESLRCSFCGRSQSVVNKLICAPHEWAPAYICDDCATQGLAASDKVQRSVNVALPQMIWRRLIGKPAAIHTLE